MPLRRFLLIAMTVSQLLATSLVSVPTAAGAAQPTNWAPPRTVYIPATGHTIDGVFLDFWRAWGGASAWGNPVTEEVEEHGHIVQYYEYARFEYWPEDPDGEVVHLGRIGVEIRPHALPRSVPPDAPKSALRTNRELARAALAWLPLDPRARPPDTDTWRFIPATRHSVQWGFKEFWETTGEANYLGNPLTEEYVFRGITYQVFERGQLAWREGAQPWMVPLGRLLAIRRGLDLAPVPQGNIPTYSEDLFVPPKPQPDPRAERWIEINLSWQYLIAWQGDVAVLETYVSTGRAGFETPTGTFFIISKYESQDMAGVIGGEYYNVPDVPWVMYFTTRGHAIHGTYWHSNFGVPMSHGCVNLPVAVAAWLYAWAPIGTRVVIH